MNKKIYFNDKCLEFSTSGPAALDAENTDIYSGIIDDERLQKIVKDFLSDTGRAHIHITGQSFPKMFEQLKEHFYYIEAAGGFIQKDDRYLCIHRHGRWDLPKGKLEKNETAERGAVRECEEECAVKNLIIKNKLSSTFHVYPYKKGFALKQSFWFHMITNYPGTLVPQTEEDIDRVEWFTASELRNTILKDTYYTIADVINEGLTVSEAAR
jgi:8-oxo-dGTP pyrophosphatase MutT (NUDIX family)